MRYGPAVQGFVCNTAVACNEIGAKMKGKSPFSGKCLYRLFGVNS